MAGGTYLRVSLYVLMIHFKKFDAFIRSVSISRLSNQTSGYEVKSHSSLPFNYSREPRLKCERVVGGLEANNAVPPPRDGVGSHW